MVYCCTHEVGQPSALETAWTTSSASRWRVTKWQVDVALESLMSWCVFGKSGYMTKEWVLAVNDWLTPTLGQDQKGRDFCVVNIVMQNDFGYLALASYVESFQMLYVSGQYYPYPNIRLLSQVYVSVWHTWIFIGKARYQLLYVLFYISLAATIGELCLQGKESCRPALQCYYLLWYRMAVDQKQSSDCLLYTSDAADE